MHIISAGPAFLDTELSLKHEFSGDNSNTAIILGGYKFALAGKTIRDFKKHYDKVIVFNQEQITTKLDKFLSLPYYAMLMEADEVWDYDFCNIHHLKFHNIRHDARLHILKPAPSLNAGICTKQFDVLFYGAINSHRQFIINQLKKHNIKVCTPVVWGNELNWYIARSKICLNIHYYYDVALQEQARMIRWVSSNANIISEPSRINYLNVNEIPYSDLVDACITYLAKTP